MDPEVVKGRPLSKEETKALLELIENSKIITTKTTNATNNKLKSEEWHRIAESFNATATSCPRTPQQLRLKWENLKKNSRKYNTRIRMNRIKTGGGVGEYIPPDEILDRVANLLGSTVCGFTVPFGGDREPECSVVAVDGDGANGGDDDNGLGEDARVLTLDKILDLEGGPTLVVPDRSIVMDSELVDNSQVVMTPDKPNRFQFNTPRSATKKRKPDEGRTARNMAIAEYCAAKKKCLEGTCDNILLQNENLKLQNTKLGLEIEKLKSELSKLQN